MSNIVVRTLTGALYIILVILSLVLHPIVFGFLTLVFNYIALRELNKMSLFPGFKSPNVTAILNCLLILVSVIVLNFRINPTYIIFSSILLIFIYFAVVLFIKEGSPVLILSNVFFGLFYITFPLLLLNLLQQTSISKEIPFTLALFIFIWTNDTFAYLSGMALGKHKMFERISPKKSWEGFAGGLIMAVAISYIFFRLFPDIGYLNWIIFAFLTAVSAVFGDFVESMLKRTAGVKDSGSIMPGHGGMLDRIDSLLFAGPAIYIFINIVLK
jgi:phosphatidate cytidylyltransferase